MGAAILADQGHRVALLAPARVASHLDAPGLHLGGELCEVCGHGALGHRRGNEDPVRALALRVGEPVGESGLEALEESFNCAEQRSARFRNRYAKPSHQLLDPSRGAVLTETRYAG